MHKCFATQSNMELNEIKQMFRLYMNGVTAASMREKGLKYRLIWGVSIQHLHEIVEEVRAKTPDVEKQKELALLLWNEDIRECKILATLLMPKELISKETAEEWLSTLTTQEMAEWLSFNLLRHLPFARELASKAIESNNRLQIICGQNILKRIG